MRTVLAIATLLVLPFSGCLGQNDEDDDGPEGYSVTITVFPSDAAPGETFTVRWRVDGPAGEIAHTGLHYGPGSVPAPTSPADYPQAAGVEEPADAPGDYSATVAIDEIGDWYFAAHAATPDGHEWSAERRLDVGIVPPTPPPVDDPVVVTITQAPTQARWGDTITVAWNLAGLPGEANETALYYSPTPVPSPASPAVYTTSAGRAAPAAVPGDYSAEVQLTTTTPTTPGSLFVRAHAERGGTSHWSDETEIPIAALAPLVHNVTAEDVGVGVPLRFEPKDAAIDAGDLVNWTNAGNFQHTVTFESLGGQADVELAVLAPGDDVQAAFPEPGTYKYRCRFHSADYDTGMVGTVVVAAA